jgi:hypothetical protein
MRKQWNVGYPKKSGVKATLVTSGRNAKTTLVISGKGDIKSFYGDSEAAPWGKYDITSIVIENGVTGIGDGAFANCCNLTAITIPDSVKGIGDRAFDHCCNLTDITIPDSVKEIGLMTFSPSYGKNVTITMLSATPPVTGKGFDSSLFRLFRHHIKAGRKMCTLSVPADAVKLYRAVDGLKYFRIRAINENDLRTCQV